MQSGSMINNRTISPVLEGDVLGDPAATAQTEADAGDSENAIETADKKPGEVAAGEFSDYDSGKENQKESSESGSRAQAKEGMSARQDNQPSIGGIKIEEDSKTADTIPKSPARGRPSACVFVASLCSTKTDDELCVSVTEHFQQWGKLSTVKVLRDTSNRPYAFVQFTNDKDCKLAIKEGHNSVLNGRNIRCEAAKVNRTLFIACRNYISESTIKVVLEEYGEIEQLVPSTDNGVICAFKSPSKGSKNWFCKFAYRDDAIRAFANLTEERSYKVEWAQNIEESDYKNGDKVEQEDESKIKFDKYSIFIGQLSSKINEKELKERFQRHGELVDITIVRRPTNTFSFIKFKDESSAAGAVERENHSMFNGKTMHVQYREIHPNTAKSHVVKSNGIALAPPPINLNRRSSSISGNKNNDGFYYTRKVSPDVHTTYPLGKNKFNGQSSNNYNRMTGFKHNSGQNYGNYNSKGFNNSGKGFAHTNKNRYSKFGDVTYRSKSETQKEDSPTPPPSVQTSDSHTLVKSGYSPSSAVNSERSDYIKPNRKTSKQEALPGNVPYFYYIPSAEMTTATGSPVTNKYSHHPGYYNPYQQYYLPYEPNQHQAPYGIPSFPVYYPATANGSEFENFPSLENED